MHRRSTENDPVSYAATAPVAAKGGSAETSSEGMGKTATTGKGASGTNGGGGGGTGVAIIQTAETVQSAVNVLVANISGLTPALTGVQIVSFSDTSVAVSLRAQFAAGSAVSFFDAEDVAAQLGLTPFVAGPYTCTPTVTNVQFVLPGDQVDGVGGATTAPATVYTGCDVCYGDGSLHTLQFKYIGAQVAPVYSSTGTCSGCGLLGDGFVFNVQGQGDGISELPDTTSVIVGNSEVKIKSSCSYGLVIGQQFDGVLELIGFQTTEGASDADVCPAQACDPCAAGRKPNTITLRLLTPNKKRIRTSDAKCVGCSSKVEPGETFSISAFPGGKVGMSATLPKLKNKVDIRIGQNKDVTVDTSCKQPLYIGMRIDRLVEVVDFVDVNDVSYAEQCTLDGGDSQQDDKQSTGSNSNHAEAITAGVAAGTAMVVAMAAVVVYIRSKRKDAITLSQGSNSAESIAEFRMPVPGMMNSLKLSLG